MEAVRDALGPGGAVRVDANGAWDVDTAVAAVRALDRAAGGLEYVEQPCRTIDELAAVRRRVDVRIAADESIRRADDPLRVAVAGAADVAVLKCTPLGGVARALRVAEAAGLPCVVSSALETSVGLAAGARAGRGAAGAGVRVRAGHAGAARRRSRARRGGGCGRSTAGSRSPALPRSRTRPCSTPTRPIPSGSGGGTTGSLGPPSCRR